MTTSKRSLRHLRAAKQRVGTVLEAFKNRHNLAGTEKLLRCEDVKIHVAG